MGGSLGGAWGNITAGRLRVDNANYGQGYCGDNAVVTNIAAVSIYQQCGAYYRGFTAFHYTVTADNYGYCLTSNGQAFTFVPNVSRAIDIRSIYIDKSNASDYEPVRYVICASLNLAVLPDNVIPVGVSGNDLFNGSDGNYYRYDGEKLNIPSGVSVVSEPFEDIYLGSDNKYYDINGEVFTNLPSGVTPVSEYAWGAYQGNDGKFYDVNGDEILEDLPSGVLPVDTLGETYIGTDGNYYKPDGDEAFQNLPEGVDIVGYDSENDSYEGSDGKEYDIDGDEWEEPCQGKLLRYTPTVRLVIDCVDIFGNQKNIGADISVGQQALDIASLFNVNYIRQINRITARPLDTDCAVGNGILRIDAPVIGAKIAVDIEGVDTDAVLGVYNVAACVFDMCDRYADIVLNEDLPIGLANHTDLDVGYFVLNHYLQFSWEGFNDTFPYCCPDYNTTEKGSGSTPSPIEDSDISRICDSIDKLTEAVENLSTLVEVVVTPAEDVNIYNRRFHYNDKDGVSGFHD